MLSTQMIDEYNEDRDEDDIEIVVPASGPLAEMVKLSDRIEGYNIEEMDLVNHLDSMRWRISEQGFDGDHDPMEPSERRLDEINVMRDELRKRIRNIKLEGDEMRMATQVIGYFTAAAEVEWERQEERRQMGISHL